MTASYYPNPQINKINFIPRPDYIESRLYSVHTKDLKNHDQNDGKTENWKEKPKQGFWDKRTK